MFAFQNTPLNRHGEVRHTEEFIKPLLELPSTFFLPVHQQSIVCARGKNSDVDKNGQPLWLQSQELKQLTGLYQEKHLIYLGESDSKHYFTFRLKSLDSLQHMAQLHPRAELELCGLRELFKQLPPEQAH